MSSNRLLWIGHSPEGAQSSRKALENALDNLVIEVAPHAREALNILAKTPSSYLIVIIDAQVAQMDIGTLATGIKQINPAIEIIVLGAAGPVMAGPDLTTLFSADSLGPVVRSGRFDLLCS